MCTARSISGPPPAPSLMVTHPPRPGIPLRRLGGVHHLLPFLRGPRQLLLTEHVLAGRQAVDGDRGVELVRHTDAHAVNVGLKHLLVVGVELTDTVRRADLRQHILIEIAQRDDLSVLVRHVALDVILADARADDSGLDLSHFPTLPASIPLRRVIFAHGFATDAVAPPRASATGGGHFSRCARPRGRMIRRSIPHQLSKE